MASRDTNEVVKALMVPPTICDRPASCLARLSRPIVLLSHHKG
jgi:hypothetical protein